jgi:predicted O-methyltransferase YrrM
MKLSRIAHRIGQYVVYLIKAINEHGVHSPFVFELLTKTIRKADSNKSRFDQIERLRSELLKNQTAINPIDFGAGPTSGNHPVSRKIKDICSSASASPAKGRLLAALASHCQPKSLLELGTNLGISTIYLAHGAPDAVITTIEGSPELASIAEKNFRSFNREQIRLVRGEFENVLPALLSSSNPIDFAYLDGNHRPEPTLGYFELIFPYCRENSVIVLDDIHWSSGMTHAWRTLAADPRVSISIDLYSIGLLFFRKGLPKQHFVLK